MERGDGTSMAPFPWGRKFIFQIFLGNSKNLQKHVEFHNRVQKLNFVTLDFKNITLISLVKDNKEDSKTLIDYLLVNKLKIHHIIADGSKYKQEKIFNKLKNPLKKYSYYG